MGKLPATSYVRMVDIWLIFGQLYPFIQGRNVSIRKLNVSADAKLFLSQVVLLTIIEMHVFEEYTNSHGFRRFAPESNKKTEEDTLVWHLTVVLVLTHLLLLFQNQQTKIGKWILPEIPSVHKIAKTCGMYCMACTVHSKSSGNTFKIKSYFPQKAWLFLALLSSSPWPTGVRLSLAILTFLITSWNKKDCTLDTCLHKIHEKINSVYSCALCNI